MGRRAKPAAIREAQGNAGRRPIVQETPATDEALGNAPDWLNNEAKAIWARLAPELQRMRLLGRPDVMAFGRYCVNMARWLAHVAALAEHGETYSITTDSGTVIRPRPEALMADRLENRLVALEDRFGLSPSERQRIYALRAAAQASPGDLFDGAAPAPSASAGDKAPPSGKGPVGLLN